MAVGFFDTFFDSDYRQRSDINDVRDDAAEARHMVAEASQFFGQRITELQKQVRDLTVLSSVLTKMLIESGVVDETVLRYRLEAELEAAIERAKPRPYVSTAEVWPVEAPPHATPTVCSKCGKTVPAHQTVITAEGTMCDGCGASAR